MISIQASSKENQTNYLVSLTAYHWSKNPETSQRPESPRWKFAESSAKLK